MVNLQDLLAGQNIDPTQKQIQVQNPVTGKVMVVPNPFYGKDPAQGAARPQADAGIGDLEDDDEKSWCPIVRNWCPESPLCVYWYGPPAGDEKPDEEPGCCVEMARIVSEDRANTAKAEFFENGVKLVKSALSGDAESSAFASLINHAATAIQLINEKTLREEEKNLPKAKKKNSEPAEKVEEAPSETEVNETEAASPDQPKEVAEVKVELPQNEDHTLIDGSDGLEVTE